MSLWERIEPKLQVWIRLLVVSKIRAAPLLDSMLPTSHRSDNPFVQNKATEPHAVYGETDISSKRVLVEKRNLRSFSHYSQQSKTCPSYEIQKMKQSSIMMDCGLCGCP